MNSQTSFCGCPYHEPRESGLWDEWDCGMTSEISVPHGALLHILERADPDIPILKEAKAESGSCLEKGSA